MKYSTESFIYAYFKQHYYSELNVDVDRLTAFVFSKFRPKEKEKILEITVNKDMSIRAAHLTMNTLIDNCFSWNDTKEGMSFWEVVYCEIKKYKFSQSLIDYVNMFITIKKEKGTLYTYKTDVDDEGDKYILEEDSEFTLSNNKEHIRITDKQGGFYFDE